MLARERFWEGLAARRRPARLCRNPAGVPYLLLAFPGSAMSRASRIAQATIRDRPRMERVGGETTCVVVVVVVVFFFSACGCFLVSSWAQRSREWIPYGAGARLQEQLQSERWQRARAPPTQALDGASCGIDVRT